MQAVAEHDTGKVGMIVKRVSVPMGLEELMEGLTKEVLLKKPKDLYIFASEYFSRLANLREQNSHHKAYPIRTVQSVTQLKTPDVSKTKKMPPPRPTRHLSRQMSVQSKSPEQRKPNQSEIIRRSNIQKINKKETIIAPKIPSKRERSVSSSRKDLTPRSTSVQSTPREKRQRSNSRQLKSSSSESKAALKTEKKMKSEKSSALKASNSDGIATVTNNVINTETTPVPIPESCDSDILAATTNVQELSKLILRNDENEEQINRKESSEGKPKIEDEIEEANEKQMQIDDELSTESAHALDDKKESDLAGTKCIEETVEMNINKAGNNVLLVKVVDGKNNEEITDLIQNDNEEEIESLNDKEVVDDSVVIENIELVDSQEPTNHSNIVEEENETKTKIEDAPKSNNSGINEEKVIIIEEQKIIDNNNSSNVHEIENVIIKEDAGNSVNNEDNRVENKSAEDNITPSDSLYENKDIKESNDLVKKNKAILEENKSEEIKRDSIEDPMPVEDNSKQEITEQGKEMKDNMLKEVNSSEETIIDGVKKAEKEQILNIKMHEMGDSDDLLIVSFAEKPGHSGELNEEKPDITLEADIKPEIVQKTQFFRENKELGSKEDKINSANGTQRKADTYNSLINEIDGKDIDIIEKIINISQEQSGGIDSNIKKYLTSFLNSEQQHVFKANASELGKETLSEEESKQSTEEINKDHTINDNPEASEKVYAEHVTTSAEESALQHQNNSLENNADGDVIITDTDSNKTLRLLKEDSLVFHSVKDLLDSDAGTTLLETTNDEETSSKKEDSDEGSNTLKLIIMEDDDSVGAVSSSIGLRNKRSATGDDIEDIVSFAENVNIDGQVRFEEEQATVQATMPSQEHDERSKSSDDKINGSSQNMETLDENKEIQENNTSAINVLNETKSDVSQEDKSIESNEAEKKNGTLTNEERDAVIEYETNQENQVPIKIEDHYKEFKPKVIENENSKIKNDAEEKLDVKRRPKIGDIDQVATVIEVVKSIFDAKRSSVDITMVREHLDTFLRNERGHIYQNVKDTKADDKKKKSKLTNDKHIRRVRSVGIIKTGDVETRSKIPTPARRSAGRRPLVRQLEANSKELEEKLNFRRSSTKSSKEDGKIDNSNNREATITKNDALIAKTILKGVQGAEKHIELIDEHLNRRNDDLPKTSEVNDDDDNKKVSSIDNEGNKTQQRFDAISSEDKVEATPEEVITTKDSLKVESNPDNEDFKRSEEETKQDLQEENDIITAKKDSMNVESMLDKRSANEDFTEKSIKRSEEEPKQDVHNQQNDVIAAKEDSMNINEYSKRSEEETKEDLQTNISKDQNEPMLEKSRVNEDSTEKSIKRSEEKPKQDLHISKEQNEVIAAKDDPMKVESMLDKSSFNEDFAEKPIKASEEQELQKKQNCIITAKEDPMKVKSMLDKSSINEDSKRSKEKTKQDLQTNISKEQNDFIGAKEDPMNVDSMLDKSSINEDSTEKLIKASEEQELQKKQNDVITAKEDPMKVELMPDKSSINEDSKRSKEETKQDLQTNISKEQNDFIGAKEDPMNVDSMLDKNSINEDSTEKSVKRSEEETKQELQKKNDVITTKEYPLNVESMLDKSSFNEDSTEKPIKASEEQELQKKQNYGITAKEDPIKFESMLDKSSINEDSKRSKEETKQDLQTNISEEQNDVIAAKEDPMNVDSMLDKSSINEDSTEKSFKRSEEETKQDLQKQNDVITTKEEPLNVELMLDKSSINEDSKRSKEETKEDLQTNISKEQNDVIAAKEDPMNVDSMLDKSSINEDSTEKSFKRSEDETKRDLQKQNDVITTKEDPLNVKSMLDKISINEDSKRSKEETKQDLPTNISKEQNDVVTTKEDPFNVESILDKSSFNEDSTEKPIKASEEQELQKKQNDGITAKEDPMKVESMLDKSSINEDSKRSKEETKQDLQTNISKEQNDVIAAKEDPMNVDSMLDKSSINEDSTEKSVKRSEEETKQDLQTNISKEENDFIAAKEDPMNVDSMLDKSSINEDSTEKSVKRSEEETKQDLQTNISKEQNDFIAAKEDPMNVDSLLDKSSINEDSTEKSVKRSEEETKQELQKKNDVIATKEDPLIVESILDKSSFNEDSTEKPIKASEEQELQKKQNDGITAQEDPMKVEWMLDKSSINEDSKRSKEETKQDLQTNISKEQNDVIAAKEDPMNVDSMLDKSSINEDSTEKSVKRSEEETKQDLQKQNDVKTAKEDAVNVESMLDKNSINEDTKRGEAEIKENLQTNKSKDQNDDITAKEDPMNVESMLDKSSINEDSKRSEEETKQDLQKQNDVITAKEDAMNIESMLDKSSINEDSKRSEEETKQDLQEQNDVITAKEDAMNVELIPDKSKSINEDQREETKQVLQFNLSKEEHNDLKMENSHSQVVSEKTNESELSNNENNDITEEKDAKTHIETNVSNNKGEINDKEKIMEILQNKDTVPLLEAKSSNDHQISSDDIRTENKDIESLQENNVLENQIECNQNEDIELKSNNDKENIKTVKSLGENVGDSENPIETENKDNDREEKGPEKVEGFNQSKNQETVDAKNGYNEERAALRIQTMWKGYVARKLMKNAQHKNEPNNQEKAIIMIQAMVRGFLDRMKYNKLKCNKIETHLEHKETATLEEDKINLTTSEQEVGSENVNTQKEASLEHTQIQKDDKGISTVSNELQHEDQTSEVKTRQAFNEDKSEESASKSDKEPNEDLKEKFTAETISGNTKLGELKTDSDNSQRNDKELELISNNPNEAVTQKDEELKILQIEQTQPENTEIKEGSGQKTLGKTEKHMEKNKEPELTSYDSKEHIEDSTKLKNSPALDVQMPNENDGNPLRDANDTNKNPSGPKSEESGEKRQINADILDANENNLIQDTKSINENSIDPKDKSKSESSGEENKVNEDVGNSKDNEKDELSKPDFYRSDTVVEPELIKKTIIHLGEDSSDSQDQKDDNNNTSKEEEETELEKDVRTAVREILSTNVDTKLTPLEAEITQAVKHIMENNVDEEDSSKTVEKDSRLDKTMSIDTVLKQLPEVPTHEIPKTITESGTSSSDSLDGENLKSSSAASLEAPADDASSVGSVDSVVTVVLKPKNETVVNKRLPPSKAFSTSALEDHVELIDQVQNSLLDQLSGKTDNKFDIEQLRKELHDAATMYKSDDEDSSALAYDPEVMEYLYDFDQEDDRMVRTPLRELPDIAEETEDIDKANFCKTPQGSIEKVIDGKPLQDHIETCKEIIINNDNIKINEEHQQLLHTSELHDSVTIPVIGSKELNTHKLKHTSEFHDTVVVPLPRGADMKIKNEVLPTEPTRANSMDSGNQTSMQQAPAGVEAVTSRRRSQDGVDVARAQASLKDTSTAKPESGGSFVYQSSPQRSPRTATRAMDSENNNNKRNNAINTDEKNMEAQAATKIQAGFRGYQVRKQLKAKNASTDQRRLRKRSSRENMKETELEEKSAVKIQAGVRGFLVRRRQKKQINSSASA